MANLSMLQKTNIINTLERLISCLGFNKQEPSEIVISHSGSLVIDRENLPGFPHQIVEMVEGLIREYFLYVKEFCPGENESFLADQLEIFQTLSAKIKENQNQNKPESLSNMLNMSNSVSMLSLAIQDVFPTPFIKALTPKNGSIEDLVKVNGPEITIKIIKTLMHPQVLPLFLAQKITIEQVAPTSKLNKDRKYWSEETTIAVAELMHDPDIEPYVTSGLMTSYMIEYWGGYKLWTMIVPYLRKNAQELIQEGILWLDVHRDDDLINLSIKCSLLSKHKDEIKKLLQDNVITKDDLRGFYFHNYFFRSRFELALERIKSHQKYFKLRLIMISETYFHDFDEKIKILDSINPRAIEAISKASCFYMVPSIRAERELFEIFTYPELSNLITNKTFTRSEIVEIWKNNKFKKYLMTVMFDEEAARQFDVLVNHTVYYRSEIKEKIMDVLESMGSMLLQPKILALVKFKLWRKGDIGFYRKWQPSAVIAYFKYDILMRLKAVFNDQEGKEVLLLKEILSQLDVVTEFSQTLSCFFGPEIKNEILINAVYAKVLVILDQLNSDPNICLSGEAEGFFSGEYQRLLDFESIDENKNGMFQLGHLYLKADQKEEAYKCFIRVTEDDADYFEATYEAANIALSQNNIEEAQYFFKKARDIAINQEVDPKILEGIVIILVGLSDPPRQEDTLMFFQPEAVKLGGIDANSSSNNSLEGRQPQDSSLEEKKPGSLENVVEAKPSNESFISSFWTKIKNLTNSTAGQSEDVESKKSMETKATYMSLK